MLLSPFVLVFKTKKKGITMLYVDEIQLYQYILKCLFHQLSLYSQRSVQIFLILTLHQQLLDLLFENLTLMKQGFET